MRALICLFLGGGNDGFNMLVPAGRGYSDYASIRSGLAIREADLLPLRPLHPAACGRVFGLHPAMFDLQQLFNGDKDPYRARRVSLFSNIGMFQNPGESSDGVRARMACGPCPAEAANDHGRAADDWMGLRWEDDGITGWMGRAADGDVGWINCSLEGYNSLQAGLMTSAIHLNTRGRRMNLVDEGAGLPELRAGGLKQLRESLRATEEPGLDLGRCIPGESPLADKLRRVARLIQAGRSCEDLRLGVFLYEGGWDHHTDLLRRHAANLGELSRCLVGFQNVMDALGLSEDVILFTASEFGRALVPSGDGSGHGWGSTGIIMGGGLGNGRLIGRYPELCKDSTDICERGVVRPTHDASELITQLCAWMTGGTLHYG